MTSSSRAAGVVVRAVAAAAAATAVALLTGAAERPSREQELATIRAEIGRLETRLAALRDRREGAAGRLEALELELDLQEERVAEASSAAAVANERAAASRRRVGRLEVALRRARDDLSRRLAGLYRLGGQGRLRLFLALDPRGDLLQGVRLVRYLARRDAVAVARYTGARDELVAERARLAARQEEAAAWLAEEEARREAVATARRGQAEALASLEDQGRRLAARAGELGERASRLARFLDLLAGSARGGPAGVPIQEVKGVLDWPVEGRVSAGFGYRLDPRYRTRVPHHGLTLDTRPGDPVRALYPGQVLFAAPFQGYGPTVVVHHPGRVFSLYAGLAELAVEARQEVTLGDTVGRAADSLYFEVRVEDRPEDPHLWLR
jgi:septal ring factor EnvC (AmiA/AmiB activator)